VQSTYLLRASDGKVTKPATDTLKQTDTERTISAYKRIAHPAVAQVVVKRKSASTSVTVKNAQPAAPLHVHV